MAMSVALKWIEPEELGAYLKKGWTEVALRFRTSEKFLIASPEEPASEPAKVECPNCGEPGEHLTTYTTLDNVTVSDYACHSRATIKKIAAMQRAHEEGMANEYPQPAQPEPVAEDWKDLDTGAKLAEHFSKVPANDLSGNPADWTPEPVAPRTCGICGEVGDHYIGWRNGGFTCARHLHDREPVAASDWRDTTDESIAFDLLTQPVAEEMPEAISTALKSMRFTASNHRISDAETKGLLDNADALESFWPTHAAQPAKARMTPELERMIYFFENLGSESSKKDAAAVRAQAAEAGKVRLPKVPIAEIRSIAEIVKRTYCDSRSTRRIEEWFAELDAAEGRK